MVYREYYGKSEVEEWKDNLYFLVSLWPVWVACILVIVAVYFINREIDLKKQEERNAIINLQSQRYVVSVAPDYSMIVLYSTPLEHSSYIEYVDIPYFWDSVAFWKTQGYSIQQMTEQKIWWNDPYPQIKVVMTK
jgi:hypothetical protein